VACASALYWACATAAVPSIFAAAALALASAAA